mgnify:CR=1
MTYGHETLQSAVGRKTKFETVSVREFDYKGSSRKSIVIKKLRSGMNYMVVQYEDGTFCKAV